MISPYPEIICFNIRSIAAYLELHEIETQVIFLPDIAFEKASVDEKHAYNDKILNEIAEKCRKSDIVGISLLSSNFEEAIQLTKCLKNKLNVPIIWGGKHPSAMPELCLKYADIVAIGESEISIVELCRKIESGQDYYDVNGFWFKRNRTIIRNPVGKILENLDDIPIKDPVSDSHYVWDRDKNTLLVMSETLYDRFLEDNLYSSGKVYYTMTSRGCPFNCSYCFTYKNIYKDQIYSRRRSVENVIEELDRMRKRSSKVNLVAIADDEFMSAGIAYLQEFCKQYKQKIKLPFSCLFHPAAVNEEKLGLLVDAGLTSVQIGMQSASERTLKLYQRNVSKKQTHRLIKLISKYSSSILPSYDFIIDNPYEQKQDIIDTIKFITQIPNPFTLNVYPLIFFPGTYLFEKAVADGLVDPQKVETYTKKFQHQTTKYINMIFHLLKYSIPPPLIMFLVSKPMVFIFDRPFTTFICKYLLHLWRITKRLTGLRRPTGGFDLDERALQISNRTQTKKL